jgi:DNA-directed RNA polymerase specialized sigma24 family protein
VVMDADASAERLSQLKTRWTLLFQAHRSGDAAAEAQRELLLRYHGAAFRYFLGALRDPGAAEELAQDFAVRFLRGDFRRASPERGSFRAFLKTALRRQMIDHWRHDPPAPPVAVEDELDRSFLARWREELLARTWEALAEAERQTGQPSCTVLRWKSERPELSAAELAGLLTAETGKPVTEAGLRQILHRARERFADLLLAEAARSLQTDDRERVEQELIDLELLDYCKSALSRRRPA